MYRYITDASVLGSVCYFCNMCLLVLCICMCEWGGEGEGLQLLSCSFVWFIVCYCVGGCFFVIVVLCEHFLGWGYVLFDIPHCKTYWIAGKWSRAEIAYVTYFDKKGISRIRIQHNTYTWNCAFNSILLVFLHVAFLNHIHFNIFVFYLSLSFYLMFWNVFLSFCIIFIFWSYCVYHYWSNTEDKSI